MQPDGLLRIRQVLYLQRSQDVQIFVQIYCKCDGDVFEQLLKALDFVYTILTKLVHYFFSLLPIVEPNECFLKNLLRLLVYFICENRLFVLCNCEVHDIKCPIERIFLSILKLYLTVGNDWLAKVYDSFIKLLSFFLQIYWGIWV